MEKTRSIFDDKNELKQLRRDKDILLDHLAKFEVPLCYECNKKLPILEDHLDNKRKHTLQKFHGLREDLVKLSYNYENEAFRLNKLKHDYKKINKQAEELEKKIDLEKNNLKELDRNYNEVLSEKIKVKQSITNENDKLNKLRNELVELNENKEMCMVWEEDNEFARKENNKLKNQLDSFKKERTILENEIREVINDINKKKNKLYQSQLEINNTEKEIEKNSVILGSLTHEFDDYQRKIKKYKNQFKENVGLYEKLKEKLKEYDMLIFKSEDEKQKKHQENIKLRTETINLDRENERLINLQSKYVTENKLLKETLNQVSSTNNEMKYELYDKEKEYNDMFNNIEVYNNQIKESKMLHEKLRNQLRDDFLHSRKKLNELREEKQNIDSEIERYSSPGSDYKFRLQETVDNYDKEIHFLNSEITNKTLTIKKLKDKLYDIEHDTEKLEQLIINVRDKVVYNKETSHHTINSALASQVDLVREEVESGRQVIKQLNYELDSIKKDNIKIKETIASEYKKKEDLNKSCNEINQRLYKLQTELEERQNKCSEIRSVLQGEENEFNKLQLEYKLKFREKEKLYEDLCQIRKDKTDLGVTYNQEKMELNNLRRNNVSINKNLQSSLLQLADGVQRGVKNDYPIINEAHSTSSNSSE